MDALWLALAFLLGLVFRHIGLPALVGYLVAGFVLNALGQHGNTLLDILPMPAFCCCCSASG